MSRPTFLAGLSLAALAFAGPAVAADNAANLSTQQDSRAITLQNYTGTQITQAKVQTSPDGREWQIAQGGISPNEAKEVIVPAHDCLTNVWVQLDGGRVLQSTEMHSCNSTKIVVRKDAITIPQEAVPGAKQHGTPG
ncbi:MAG: hypothetical protein JOY66_09020 [Acetobacteraceae bacterium]|nr:hypothetical protein [Acetobacteraceae bacterium]